jgi:hypothetical protein
LKTQDRKHSRLEETGDESGEGIPASQLGKSKDANCKILGEDHGRQPDNFHRVDVTDMEGNGGAYNGDSTDSQEENVGENQGSDFRASNMKRNSLDARGGARESIRGAHGSFEGMGAHVEKLGHAPARQEEGALGQKASPEGSVYKGPLITDVAQTIKAAQEANRNP